MQNGDEALAEHHLAGRGQLLKILKTLQPHDIL